MWNPKLCSFLVCYRHQEDHHFHHPNICHWRQSVHLVFVVYQLFGHFPWQLLINVLSAVTPSNFSCFFVRTLSARCISVFVFQQRDPRKRICARPRTLANPRGISFILLPHMSSSSREVMKSFPVLLEKLCNKSFPMKEVVVDVLWHYVSVTKTFAVHKCNAVQTLLISKINALCSIYAFFRIEVCDEWSSVTFQLFPSSLKSNLLYSLEPPTL